MGLCQLYILILKLNGFASNFLQITKNLANNTKIRNNTILLSTQQTIFDSCLPVLMNNKRRNYLEHRLENYIASMYFQS